MIKAVLFDYGGVLSPGGGPGTVQRIFSQIYGVDPHEMDHDGDILIQARQGVVSGPEFFAEMNRRHPNGPRANRDNYLSNSDIFVKSEQVYKLAERLKQAGTKVGILSNINDVAADELRRRGFYDGFDQVILSYQEGVAKPEPLFYKIAVEKMGVQPQEVVLIDDQDKFRSSAEATGMHFILATSPQQIVDDVEATILAQNHIRLQ